MRHFLRLFFTPVLREGASVVAPKGFPGGSDGKEPACQRRRPGLDLWVGKISWRRKCQPTPVFWPGESHGQRSLVATVHGAAESRARPSDWTTLGMHVAAPNRSARWGQREVLPSLRPAHPLAPSSAAWTHLSSQRPPKSPLGPGHDACGNPFPSTESQTPERQDPRTQGLCSPMCPSEFLISASTACSGMTTDTLSRRGGFPVRWRSVFPALWLPSSQLPWCWWSVAVAVFTGEGGLTSPALMLVLPLVLSLCAGKDKCHVLYTGVSWLKRADSIKKISHWWHEAVLPSLLPRIHVSHVNFISDDQK